MSDLKIVSIAIIGFIALGPYLERFFFYIVPSLAVMLILFAKIKTKAKPDRVIDKWGYVVLTQNNELEHRYIAKQLLGRDLASNEVVHHINGKRSDNLLRNLCVMDRTKHEHLHAWLGWKKSKTGRYPTFREQKVELVEEYGGILLEDIQVETQVYTEPEVIDASYAITEEAPSRCSKKSELQNKLYEELRKERKRIANDKSIPVYVIFHNSTLMEMAEVMPESEMIMLQISGVGHTRFKMYGEFFITVIKKFKSDLNKNSA